MTFSIQGISLSTYSQTGYAQSGPSVLKAPDGSPNILYLLQDAKAANANYVELSNFVHLSVSTGQISDYLNAGGTDSTANFADIEKAVASAEAMGLNVMLKPQVGDYHPDGQFANLWDSTMTI